MKNKKLAAFIISALLFLVPAGFLGAQENDQDNMQESESAVSDDYGSFDFSEEFSDIKAEPAGSAKGIDFGGSIETETGIRQKDGDLSRSFIRADLDMAYTNDGTEIRATFRGETDSLHDTSSYFKSSDALGETRSRMTENSYDAASINKAGDDNNAIKENGSDSRFYLREAYINQSFNVGSDILDSVNLKAGKIIYTWGNADDVKPVDILNHQDLTQSMIKPLQERKYGEISTDLSLYFAHNIFFESVFMPYFEANEVSSTQFGQSSLESEQIVNSPVLPDQGIKNFSYANRIGFSLYDVDMHLNHFYGIDRTQSLVAHMSEEGIMIDQNALATAALTGGDPMDGVTAPEVYYTQEYKKIQMLGFDFQRALFSGIAARGEAAYFYQGKNYYAEKDIDIYIDGEKASDEQIASLLQTAAQMGVDTSALSSGATMPVAEEKDLLEYTIGLDDMDLFGIENLYANLQFHQKIIMDYDDELTDEQYTNWIIAKLEYSMLRNKLKGSFKTIWDVGDMSCAMIIEPSYKVSEMCTLSGGTVQFVGDEDNIIGQYNDDDYYYVNMEAAF